MEYEKLHNSYVIFLCDFDPIGYGLYRYTFDTVCRENGCVLQDGRKTVFLNTAGTNSDGISNELKTFLDFVRSNKNVENDEYVNTIENSVNNIKKRREMRSRYMKFEELLVKEKAEGKRDILYTYSWLKENGRSQEAEELMKPENDDLRDQLIDEYLGTAEVIK